MVQRDTGRLSQSTVDGLQPQRDIATARSMGSNPQGNMRSFPGNVISPRELTNVPAEAVVVGEQYLVFSLLECELALKAEHIDGVERLADVTPVPNVASWISGVINLRGSIASVVDLRSFLGMERLPFNPRTRLLSVKYNEMVIALVVDSVSEMIPIPPSAINGIVRQANIPQWLASYASGSTLVGNRYIILLDTARLLFSDKMQHDISRSQEYPGDISKCCFKREEAWRMNDTDRGGMTVSSLLVMGLAASVAIPVIAIIVLGILIRGVVDQTVVVYMVGLCALIVLLGVLFVNYFVRRRILDRVQGLVDVCRKYAAGDRSVRALVIGDDEFAMLSMSINTLFDNQGFASGGIGAPASGSSDAAALQAQIEKLLQEVSAVGDGDL